MKPPAQHLEYACGLVTEMGHALGFDVMSGSRRVNMGSGLLASKYLTRWGHCPVVSSMLTTDALNISSLRWFEAGLRRQTPVDLPPSLYELIAQQI